MSEVRKEIINRLTKLSGTIEADEISEEIKQISKRFNNGEETIEDILNHCRHYILKLENGRKLDLVEKKYLDKLIDKCKKLSAEREADKKRIEELKKYIVVAPNLDEMTATKYMIIQEESYIIGKVEAKQKAKELEEKYNQLMNEYHKRVQEIIDLEQDLKILQDDLEDKRIVYIDTPEFKDSYIAKEKIKDKIKKLEEKMKYENNEKILVYLHKQRKILRELLEDK